MVRLVEPGHDGYDLVHPSRKPAMRQIDGREHEDEHGCLHRKEPPDRYRSRPDEQQATDGDQRPHGEDPLPGSALRQDGVVHDVTERPPERDGPPRTVGELLDVVEPAGAGVVAQVGPTDDGVRDSEDGGAKPADQSIDPRAVVSRPVDCIVGADQDVAGRVMPVSTSREVSWDGEHMTSSCGQTCNSVEFIPSISTIYS